MPSRRHVLRAGVAAAALAGCLGSPSTTTTTPDRSTTTRATTDHSTTERRTSTTTDAPDALRWTLDTGSEIERAPVVHDGTVYAPGRALHAVAADGTERWQYRAAAPVQSRPLVRASGVYVVTGSYQGSPAGSKFAAHALDRDGSRRWTHHASHGMVSVLDATADAAYVGTHDDYLQKTGESLHALAAADGGQRWRAGIGDAERGLVARDTVVAGYRRGVAAFDAADGSVQWRTSARSLGGVAGDAVVVAGESAVAALAVADGAEQWTFTPPAEPTTATVVDETVYVGTYDGSLHAVDAASGEEHWRASVGGHGYLPPSVTPDAVYVVGDGVHALDAATGDRHWRVDAGKGRVRVAADARGVYLSERATLHALAPDGTERWRYRADAPLTAPAVGDGVYVADRGGTLAALRP